jgi:nitroreductase
MHTKLTRVLKVLQLFTEYTQDIWLFLRYNGFSPFEALERRLSHKTIIEAHTIEKGLALPEPRPHFGRDKVKALLDMNDGWSPKPDELSRSMLLGALRDYRTFSSNAPAPDPALLKRVDSFLDTPNTDRAVGGVHQELALETKFDEAAANFLRRRFSARDFAPLPLNNQQVSDVVELAQRAPSQCNRQSSRLHVYRDKEKISKLLDLQGGARGFIDAVPTLFVVTSEITAWGGPQQRNQPYVDGGIFTTMLLLALQAHGFISCPMNLGVTNRVERAIKDEGDIPCRERLIVMVAAGQPPNSPLRAANSPRWNTEKICNFH